MLTEDVLADKIYPGLLGADRTAAMRIGIIDSYPIIHIGLKAILQTRFKSTAVYTAKDPEEMEKQVRLEQTDLLIIGLSADQHHDFHELFLASVRRFPQTPVMICFDSIDQEIVMNCLKLGASGYCLKTGDIDEFLLCVERVSEGKRYMCEPLENIMVDMVLGQRVKPRSKSEVLTTRERVLATHISGGLKTAAIAMLMNIKPSTVNTMKVNICKKLGVKSATELMKILQDS